MLIDSYIDLDSTRSTFLEQNKKKETNTLELDTFLFAYAHIKIRNAYILPFFAKNRLLFLLLFASR